MDGERVCAGADGLVNEVQYLLQVQALEYLNRRAGGEWPRSPHSMCNDEALGAVKRVRWPAASKPRTLAAARQAAWNCKQVTPETGIESPGRPEEARAADAVRLFALFPTVAEKVLVPAIRQEQE